MRDVAINLAGAIKLEALDRKVEVISGNTPHASSASTPSIVAKVLPCIKGASNMVGGR